jgi:hypothetical protein
MYIRTVTARFSLDSLHELTGRNYNSEAVSDTLAATPFNLGEVYGLFGQKSRIGKFAPDIGKFVPDLKNSPHALYRNGEPVTLNSWPAIRVLSAEIEGRIVTMELGILKTPMGEIVDALDALELGGWSWAALGTFQGVDDQKEVIMEQFVGCDFVRTTNMHNLNRPPVQLTPEEEAEKEFRAKLALEALGYSEKSAVDVWKMFLTF